MMDGIDSYIDENMLEFVRGNRPAVDHDADYMVDESGEQHMNGWQGVQYLRARKYADGTAPMRDARNQDVMQQLFEKTQIRHMHI